MTATDPAAPASTARRAVRTTNHHEELPVTRLLLFPYVHVRCTVLHAQHRLRSDQRGEGVISAAIAVLVMAFLGVAMYKAFQGMFQDTADKTTNQINQIGG